MCGKIRIKPRYFKTTKIGSLKKKIFFSFSLLKNIFLIKLYNFNFNQKNAVFHDFKMTVVRRSFNISECRDMSNDISREEV